MGEVFPLAAISYAAPLSGSGRLGRIAHTRPGGGFQPLLTTHRNQKANNVKRIHRPPANAPAKKIILLTLKCELQFINMSNWYSGFAFRKSRF